LEILQSTVDGALPVFDCAIIDLMMPYLDGFELLKWIRHQEETKGMWVVLMTAKAQSRDTFAGYPYQPDRYISKPFNPADLLV
jgi:two-component system alkaline phosphatase synthesis response regulator PhoP/two-component system response regulator VicR